jgi:hypothetical protein
VRGMGSGRMHGSARFILAVGILLPTAVAMPGAVAAGPQVVAELAGVTVVTGSTSASMPVHLSQPAALNPWKVGFEGAGRIFGFVLHGDGDRGGATGATPLAVATAVAVHINYCLAPGCTNPDFYGGYKFGAVAVPDGYRHSGIPFDFAGGTLPSGDYHLQLIADGEPVTVTIPLDGLSGQVQLAPTGPAGQTLTTPPPDLTLPAPAKVAYSAGSTHTVEQFGGMFIGTFWVDEPLPHEVNNGDACQFSGQPPPRTRYQGPCLSDGVLSVNVFPSGSAPVGTARGPLGLYERYRAVGDFMGGTGPGVFSAGAYNEVAGPAIEGHLQLIWIDFLA